VLTYEVELTPVFGVRQGFDDRIQVRYKDLPVESLYSCRVVMRNSGNVALSNRPLPIELKGNVTVLEERFETVPGLEFGEKGEIEVDEESSSRWRHKYKVEWLNPGEEISVGLIVAGDLTLSEIAVPARGGGLKCLRKSSYASKQVLWKGAHSAVWVVLGIGCLVTVTGLRPEHRVILWSGLVPAVLSYWILYLVDLLRSPRKRLSYKITPPKPLFNVVGSSRKNVSVEYRGASVKDLYTCQVILRNTGNRSLEDQSVVVQLKGANILQSTIHTEPELKFETVGLDDSPTNDGRKYHFPELEPNDKVTINFTFEGKVFSEDIEVGARGEMLEVECEREGSKTAYTTATAAISIWIITLLSMIVLSVLGIGYLRGLWYLIYDWFLRISARPGFWVGYVFGTVAFATIAFVVSQIQLWWRETTTLFKPQMVAHLTSATPAQVTNSSRRALMLGLLVFASIICVLIGILFPGTLERILHAIGMRY
jgi:hypothetical protein